MVQDQREIGVFCRGVELQTDQRIDGRLLWNEVERPSLLVLELDQSVVVSDDLVAEVFGSWEKLWQAEPLSCHLVSICGDISIVGLARRQPRRLTVGVDELVVIDTGYENACQHTAIAHHGGR